MQIPYNLKRLNFLDLLDYLQIERYGNKIFSIFKDENDPSMHIYEQTQTFKCYSTGKYGSIVDFYTHYKNVPEEQAISELETIYNTLVKDNKHHALIKNSNQTIRPFKSGDEKKKIYNKVFTFLFDIFYEKPLPDDVEEYLLGPKRKLYRGVEHSRGIFYISDLEDTIKQLRENFTDEELKISGLFTPKNYFIFTKHRLIISYFNLYYDKDGDAIFYFKYLRGRYFENGSDTPPQGTSKYIGLCNFSTKRFYYTPNFSDKFGLQKSPFDAEKVLILEGEFDTILAERKGIGCFGILGVSNIPEQILPKFYGKEVYVCFDNDEAGRRAIYDFARKYNNPIHGVFLKNHKDLTEWYNGDHKRNILEDTENVEIIDIYPNDVYPGYSKTNFKGENNSSGEIPFNNKAANTLIPAIKPNQMTDDTIQNQPSNNEKNNLLSANKLLEEDIPEPNWFIKNFLIEGLTILAGKPKTGKSWLALNISFSVAQGKKLFNQYYTEQHEVLYLAYEDTKRRLKKRITQLKQSEYYYCDQVDNIFFPDKLHLKSLNTGGLEELEKLITENNNIKVVIIDTFGASFVPPKKSVDTFQENYQMILKLQKFAMQYSIAVILIHHLKKMKGELAQDGILGSTGITAACDSTMILEVDKDKNAVIEINGRDVLNERIAVEHDQETGVWELRGEETDLTIERQTILDIFKAEPERIFQTKDIAELTNTSRPNASKLLKKLAEDGFIERVKSGKYILDKKKEDQVE